MSTNALATGEAFEKKQQYLAALRALDEVDAWCDCSQFTAGDEPAEYAAARLWIRKLEEQEGSQAFGELNPRGPILRELAKARSKDAAKAR